MAGWVKCLFLKQKDLNSDPQHPLKARPGGMCNPNAGGYGAGRSQSLAGQPVQLKWQALGSLSQLVSKKKKKKVERLSPANKSPELHRVVF